MADVYWDFLNGNDSTGAGTTGNPYKTLQGCLDNTTPADATRFLGNDNTDEVMSAALNFSSPNNWSSRDCIIGPWQDGGNGRIGFDFNSTTVTLFSASNSVNYKQWVYCDFYDSGMTSGVWANPGQNSCFFGCHFTDIATTGTVLELNRYSSAEGCYFFDFAGIGIALSDRGAHTMGCVLKDGASRNMSNGIQANANCGAIQGCIVWMNQSSGTNSAIYTRSGSSVVQCTVYNQGGAGYGINCENNERTMTIRNNHIENFTEGIRATASNTVLIQGHNSFWSNTTDRNISGASYDIGGNLTSLGASPLTDPTNGDFSVSAALKALADPSALPGISTNQYLDIGAAQRVEAGGAQAKLKRRRYVNGWNF